MHLKKSFDTSDRINVRRLYLFIMIQIEEMHKVNAENTKLKYRQKILLKTIEDLENSASKKI